ncbi:FecR domain-containing protein, partial [Patescibacteria group bacterium]|nr:FecR domain-containing protein [Patescibacteria group bacterium]
MKFEKSKKGFSLVELIITVVIIGVLSVIAYIGINGTGNWFKNEKVKDDLIAISNALENYKRDHFGAYPIQDPGDNANMLCFAADASYTHDCDSSAFRQGMIDNDLLTKRYLQEVPTDPRTDSRYVYGVSADGKYFQVAGVVYEDGNYRAETVENLGKGFYLPSLIRAYDSPNFVVHESSDNLPYSPNTTTITAKLDNINGAVTINGDPASTDVTLYAGDIIEVSAGGTVNVYFSDGSVSTLGSATNTSTLEILDTSEVAENDEDNIITKIYLKLTQGKIWNKVVRLASESEFNIETTAAIAGVRGTEFGIDADNTELIVYSGEVRMRLKLPDELALGNNPVPFDIDVFTEDMIATPDPITGDPLLYDNITDQVVGTGDPLSGDNETYFNDIYDQSTIHNGLVPYIVAVDETNVDYKVYVSFNGITSQPGYLDSDVHNGFEIYSGVDQDRQLDGLNVISHGEVPDINYQSDPGLDYYQTYYFDYNFSGIGAPIVLQAFKDGSYSNISWPPIQFSDTPSGTIYDYTNPEITPELALQAYIAGGRSGYAVNEPIGLEAIVMNEKDPGNSEYLWSFKSVPTGSVVYLNP